MVLFGIIYILCSNEFFFSELAKNLLPTGKKPVKTALMTSL